MRIILLHINIHRSEAEQSLLRRICFSRQIETEGYGWRLISRLNRKRREILGKHCKRRWRNRRKSRSTNNTQQLIWFTVWVAKNKFNLLPHSVGGTVRFAAINTVHLARAHTFDVPRNYFCFRQCVIDSAKSLSNHVCIVFYAKMNASNFLETEHKL